jgi:N-6 DNA Methylase
MTSPGTGSLETRAFRIADAATAAWQSAERSGSTEIPLGVVGALCLMAATDPPDPGKQITALDEPGFGALLRHIWAHFAIARPELCIRAGPLARWLEDATDTQLAPALAVARAVIGTGELFATPERNLVKHADLLGCVYQALCNPRASKIRGEVYTPADVADLIVRVKLGNDRPHPGQVIVDECAGTGAFIRAVAQLLRERGIDPQTMHWYAADNDPVAVAALAVNAVAWELGSHVVLGRADILTEPEWTARAHAEQARALQLHALRLTVAQVLAADYVISSEEPPDWGKAQRL